MSLSTFVGNQEKKSRKSKSEQIYLKQHPDVNLSSALVISVLVCESHVGSLGEKLNSEHHQTEV